MRARRPVNSFLVKEGSSWALVDAGPSDTYLQALLACRCSAIRCRAKADLVPLVQNAASDLAAAVKATVPPGDSLAAILGEHNAVHPASLAVHKRQLVLKLFRHAVTHVHPDHVGAIPQLLADWPKALVIVHASERVYLTRNYSMFPPSLGLRVLGVIPTHQVQISDTRCDR